MRIKLNAFDKDSSGSYSKTVDVESKESLAIAEDDFARQVPFSRWFFDHENLGDDSTGDEWIDWLENREESPKAT